MFEHKAPGDKRTNLFGGVGTVEVWNLMGAAQMPPFHAALACTLSPGGNVGKHVQQEAAEIVICLSGRGEARVNDKPCALRPFDVVHLPLGATLAIANLSPTEELHYLIVKAGS
ncbi:MAG: cupin domain-containing protein [Sandaracinaceae bacterium]|nr:cupin domain-containing protein [Sandaracinaceae bacterium]